MKPEHEIINRTFLIREIVRDSRPLLSKAWHYHTEIEICYTSQSRGRRFVGNQIADYFEDDLVIFGENLPHGFVTNMQCTQIVIQFDKNYLGNEININPEYAQIVHLLELAKTGLEFHGKTKEKAIKIIKKLTHAKGLKKLILLLKLLNTLSKHNQYTSICSDEYALKISESNLGRMKKVYDYVFEHYTKRINIHDVAALIHLSDASFYRFFKQHAEKTFTTFVNEIRVHHAGRILLSSKMTIAQVCYESGFNNLSYFNRKFKETMGLTPKEFRQRERHCLKQPMY
ncbi:MAG TPA: AraC family transcriptional regulator [Saprospiraceae bacterium]|nr:AraC family transcriptional regulator [Saprospiraceae bacterium]